LAIVPVEVNGEFEMLIAQAAENDLEKDEYI
jgi:hypothetical protein